MLIRLDSIGSNKNLKIPVFTNQSSNLTQQIGRELEFPKIFEKKRAMNHVVNLLCMIDPTQNFKVNSESERFNRRLLLFTQFFSNI